MKIINLMLCCLYSWLLNAQSQVTKLTPAQFDHQIKSVKGAVILDVRTPEEFNGGSISGAINIDYNNRQFQSLVRQLDPVKSYYVYCLSGGRSTSAADWMRKNGFSNVYELDGGVLAWRNQGLVTISHGKVDNSDQISHESYQLIIKKGKMVLIDFYAPWCAPCKRMEPLLSQLTVDYKDKVIITRINIDENKNLSRILGIDEIPYFKLYKNGKEMGNFMGEMDRASFERIFQDQ